MKFYIVKDQKVTLTLKEGRGVAASLMLKRNGLLEITNIRPHPHEKGSEVSKEICKLLEKTLNPTADSGEEKRDDSGPSCSKRGRLDLEDGSPLPPDDQVQRRASLSLYFVYSDTTHQFSVTGRTTGLLRHFKNVFQVEPTTKMKLRIRAHLWFQEASQIQGGANAVKYFGSLATTVGAPSKISEDTYGFLGFPRLLIPHSLLSATSVNRNQEGPRELWNKTDLTFIAKFTVGLAVDGVSDDFFLDKDIKDKMSINRKLLTEALNSDVKIIADNGTIINCHKVFLSAHSQVFASMLNGNFVEATTKEIKLPGKTEESIRALLAYLYCWDTSVPFSDPVIAVQLYKIAHEYDIKPLQTCMEKILAEKKNADDWLDTEMALSLFPYVGNRDDKDVMKKAVLRFVISNGKKMRESESFREIFEKTPNAAIDLFEEICVWKKEDI